MLTREQAFALVRQNISKKNVFYHVIAVEAIMKALARDFEENEEKWGLTGLLHDVDYKKPRRLQTCTVCWLRTF